MDDQRSYWDRVASTKTFTHPLDERWFVETVGRDARVLDYGCGYGRTLTTLAGLGYVNLVGVDPAPRMVERARRENPNLDVRALGGLPLPDEDYSYDVIVLFAVLTCIPADGDQDALMAELRRLLRPGGLLYISDMPLQSDARNAARYREARPRFGRYGVFETEDGAVVRHHDDERLRALCKGLDEVRRREVELTTMNGNPATAVQLILRSQAGTDFESNS